MRPAFALAGAAIASLLLLPPTPAHATPSVDVIESFRPGQLSGDGQVVIGEQDGQAVYWRRGTDEVVPLGFLPGATSSTAEAVSADGSVIVGNSGDEAFRWTSETGMVGLGTLPGGDARSRVTEVSADGSWIVGSASSSAGTEAFIWSADAGMVGLGFTPLGGVEAAAPYSSVARGVSDDGGVVVGSISTRPDAGTPSFVTEPFRWTPESGLVLLDRPQDDAMAMGNTATFVTGDGSTIFGQYERYTDTRALVWDEQGGYERLTGSSQTTYVDVLYDLASDGSVGVGTVFGGSDLPGGRVDGAAIWTPERGYEDLLLVLSALGIEANDFDAVNIQSAFAISDDGSVMLVRGLRATGTTYFLVTIPEPGTGLLLAVGLCALGHRRSASIRSRRPGGGGCRRV